MSKQMLWLFGLSFIAAIALQFLTAGAATRFDLGSAIGSAAMFVFIPCIASTIPAFIYWIFKRQRMPELTVVIWVLWGLFALMSIAGSMMLGGK